MEAFIRCTAYIKKFEWDSLLIPTAWDRHREGYVGCKRSQLVRLKHYPCTILLLFNWILSVGWYIPGLPFVRNLLLIDICFVGAVTSCVSHTGILVQFNKKSFQLSQLTNKVSVHNKIKSLKWFGQETYRLLELVLLIGWFTRIYPVPVNINWFR